MSEETEESTPPTVTAIEDARPANRKFYVAEMKAMKNGDIEAYVSTESIDRVGDVVRAKGWQIDNYIKTGAPVLFSHDCSQPPIGKAIDIQVQRKGLWSVTRFHEKTQLSRDLAILARGGDMKSWSVGFSALEEPERRMEDGVFKGYIFNKQELLEYSLVPVPANAEAVSKAIHLAHAGKISNQTLNYFAGPSPLAEEGSGTERTSTEVPTDEHQAKMAGMSFLKRFYDGNKA
jgi:HK97 family phage prohead protease